MSGLNDDGTLSLSFLTSLIFHVGLDGGPGLINDGSGGVVDGLQWGAGNNLFWDIDQLFWGV